MGYTDLQVTSNFSFLQGASHPEELVHQAAALGYKEIAVTDRNTLAGVVRAHVAAKEKNIRLLPGCRLQLQDGPDLLAWPTSRHGWEQLSALLTKGNLRAEKGDCHLFREDVYAHTQDLLFATVAPPDLTFQYQLCPQFKQAASEYREALGTQLYLAASRNYQGQDAKRLHQLQQLASHLHIPLVATNDVFYHQAERRQLQDILTCVREKCTIYNAGLRLYPNAERHIKPIAEMERLFRQYPDALRRTQEIAEACRFDLSSLTYVYPVETTTEGRTPQQELEWLTWKGAEDFYGKEVPEQIQRNIRYELKFMEEMNFAAYFLTVYDIVRFARSKNILCQGRGSAANSTVCFCLGITSVNPAKFDLLFERFISSARNEPPDIDVDFEHERREEVIQYIYEKYGRDRAGIVATVTQLHTKGAIRDVGKAMGLSGDALSRLSSSSWELTEEWQAGGKPSEQGFHPADPHLRKILELTRQLKGFPRQLGQHTGGFVITQGKLSDLCPVMNARMKNRTSIEWNKDDIDALRFLKIDVLALGMLTCLRKAFDLAREHHGQHFTLANIPQDDKAVYEMISHADTIGVFQIESRAQQSMLPRLRPQSFYDLVIEVAIVRPGPIQGDMVHPYLRRRNGEEEVTYPSPELEAILNKTKGVPLFQEQAMKIAIVAADFTPTEADMLRKSMATFKSTGQVTMFRDKLINGMVKKGYEEDFAKRIFKQLEGFGSYGFPESHAASFALLVYVSCYLKCYYPDVFTCAILNSMPMGFYQPAQLISDARNHGVEVRPVDVNHSCRNNTLEEKTGKHCALRLGFRQVKGLNEEDMQLLEKARTRPYTSLTQLYHAGMPITALERLAAADAFRSMGLDRRKALWEVAALQDTPANMFAGQPGNSTWEHQIALPEMTASEHVIQDYASTTLSLKAHPISFIREKLQLLRILPASRIPELPDGAYVKVAGLILVRQRPGTAEGVCFITLEDETGTLNLVVFQKLFDQYRREIVQSRLLMVDGRVQKEGEVIHIVVKRCYNGNKLLRQLVPGNAEAATPAAPASVAKEVRQESIFYGGRNFH